MLKVYKNTIVYVACPPWAQTGGPEALHTLAYELRNIGINAYIYYGKQCSNPVAEAYKKFELPFVFEIEENPENIIIVPEIWGHVLNKHPNMQRVFYWLSVNNHSGTSPIDYNDESINHFAQSYYAQDYLKKSNIKNIYFVSDYLNEFYTSNSPKKFCKREDIVLYNPAKGYNITETIINQAPHINFVPITGMKQEEILDLCLKSKVYIDFGSHPGKDRLPRETAILGNIIITNKEGSAKFYNDIPIKDEYKFQDVLGSTSQVISKIEFCLKNYEMCINDFAGYRNMILNEKEKFIKDINIAFTKVLH